MIAGTKFSLNFIVVGFYPFRQNFLCVYNIYIFLSSLLRALLNAVRGRGFVRFADEVLSSSRMRFYHTARLDKLKIRQ